jgi:hypothetical protein
MRFTTLGRLIHDSDPSLIQPTKTQAETGGLGARTRFIKIMKAEATWSNLENAVNDCARSIERGTAPFEYVDAVIEHVVGCVERGTTHVDIGVSVIAKIASAMLKQSEYGINRNDSVWIADTEILHRNAAWALERIYAISVTDAQLITLSKRAEKRLVRLCQRYDAYESMTWFMHNEYGIWII